MAAGYVYGTFQSMGLSVLGPFNYIFITGVATDVEKLAYAFLLSAVMFVCVGAVMFMIGRSALHAKRNISKIGQEEMICTIVLFLAMSSFLVFAGLYLQGNDLLHFLQYVFLGVCFMFVSIFIFSTGSPDQERETKDFETP